MSAPADNPITGVSVWAGDVVQGLSFTFKDGSTSPHFGSTGGSRSDFSFYDEDDQGRKTWQILSSTYVNGASACYRCADAVVFGYQYERPSQSLIVRSLTCAYDHPGGPAGAGHALKGLDEPAGWQARPGPGDDQRVTGQMHCRMTRACGMGTWRVHACRAGGSAVTECPSSTPDL